MQEFSLAPRSRRVLCGTQGEEMDRGTIVGAGSGARGAGRAARSAVHASIDLSLTQRLELQSLPAAKHGSGAIDSAEVGVIPGIPEEDGSERCGQNPLLRCVVCFRCCRAARLRQVHVISARFRCASLARLTLIGARLHDCSAPSRGTSRGNSQSRELGTGAAGPPSDEKSDDAKESKAAELAPGSLAEDGAASEAREAGDEGSRNADSCSADAVEAGRDEVPLGSNGAARSGGVAWTIGGGDDEERPRRAPPRSVRSGPARSGSLQRGAEAPGEDDAPKEEAVRRPVAWTIEFDDDDDDDALVNGLPHSAPGQTGSLHGSRPLLGREVRTSSGPRLGSAGGARGRARSSDGLGGPRRVATEGPLGGTLKRVDFSANSGPFRPGPAGSSGAVSLRSSGAARVGGEWRWAAGSKRTGEGDDEDHDEVRDRWVGTHEDGEYVRRWEDNSEDGEDPRGEQSEDTRAVGRGAARRAEAHQLLDEGHGRWSDTQAADGGLEGYEDDDVYDDDVEEEGGQWSSAMVGQSHYDDAGEGSAGDVKGEKVIVRQRNKGGEMIHPGALREADVLQDTQVGPEMELGPLDGSLCC